MSEKVRLVRGTCPKHGRQIAQILSADRPRCPKCYRNYSGRDGREFLQHLAPYGAADWETARTVSELRTCDRAFGREWSPRRNRLGFCALARMYFAHAQQYWLWRAVEIGEIWADSDAPSAEAADIFSRLGDGFDRGSPGPSRPVEWSWLAAACVCDREEITDDFDWDQRPFLYPPPSFDFGAGAESSLAPAPATVYRELTANPFVPLAWSPGWLTDTVRDLAAHIYEASEFGAMPILADALQDAGCDHAHVLAHCRANKPHARGCWVLDAILGKS